MPFATAVQGFFNTYRRVVNVTFPQSPGNNYEFYVYTLVLQALSTTYDLSHKKLVGGRFKFNCGPSSINTVNSYFLITNLIDPLKKFEVRSGIQFEGASMDHEMDISVIPPQPDPAPYGFPNRSNLKLVIECKKYTAERLLKGEIRKTLGAMTDLAFKAKGAINPAVTMPHWITFRYPFPAIFTSTVNINRHTDFRSYLSLYEIAQFGELEPGQPNETNFIQAIQNIAATW